MPNPTQLDLREYPLGVQLGEFRKFAATLPDHTLVRLPDFRPVRNLTVQACQWMTSGTQFLAIVPHADEADHGLALGQVVALVAGYHDSAEFFLDRERKLFLRQIRVVSDDGQPYMILEP